MPDGHSTLAVVMSSKQQLQQQQQNNKHPVLKRTKKRFLIPSDPTRPLTPIASTEDQHGGVPFSCVRPRASPLSNRREESSMEEEDRLGALLHRAVLMGAASARAVLDSSGANSNCRVQGHHALHLAAANADEDTVRLLLDRGSHVNVANRVGWSPLHYAALAGHTGVCELLLRRGAWPCSRDNNLFTPMHVLSTRAADLEVLSCIASVLLESGGRGCLEAKDAQGNTPLHIAASCGNANMCLLLLQMGADASQLNGDGKRPGAWWQPSVTRSLKHDVKRVLLNVKEVARSSSKAVVVPSVLAAGPRQLVAGAC
jgi:hypothetical protein